MQHSASKTLQGPTQNHHRRNRAEKATRNRLRMWFKHALASRKAQAACGEETDSKPYFSLTAARYTCLFCRYSPTGLGRTVPAGLLPALSRGQNLRPSQIED